MPELIQAIVIDDGISEDELRKRVLRHRARRLFLPEENNLDLQLRISVQRFQGESPKDLAAALGPGPNLILAPRGIRKILVEALREAAVPVSEV